MRLLFSFRWKANTAYLPTYLGRYVRILRYPNKRKKLQKCYLRYFCLKQCKYNLLNNPSIFVSTLKFSLESKICWFSFLILQRGCWLTWKMIKNRVWHWERESVRKANSLKHFFSYLLPYFAASVLTEISSNFFTYITPRLQWILSRLTLAYFWQILLPTLTHQFKYIIMHNVAELHFVVFTFGGNIS